ncbi:MAG: hypothetical protein IRZ04_04425 [Rhodospirillales bacterium]|nr:hypothetical protein [Rhodospirillales bacterium]
MLRRHGSAAGLALLALGSLAAPAAASCGAAFCTVNTSWNTQTPLTDSGTRLDLRFEFIKQDQPRRGNRDIAVGEIPRHHDEVQTINRNLVLSLDHNFDANWGVSVTVPLVDRRHEHVHNHHGGQMPETWDFTELGDIRLLGRYQVQGDNPATVHGVLAGVKLPTGDFTVRNEAGDLAERTLQPGTGTTDALLGGFFHDTLPIPDSAWFVQLLGQVPFNERAGFRPGYQLHLDLGYTYQPLPDLALLLQLNTTRKGRDSGPNAEFEDSGSWTVALSPGISCAVLDNVNLYGFVQVPVYQYVSGVQLVADWAGVVGVSTRF